MIGARESWVWYVKMMQAKEEVEHEAMSVWGESPLKKRDSHDLDGPVFSCE